LPASADSLNPTAAMILLHGRALRLLLSLPLLAAWFAVPVTAEDAPVDFTREVARDELTATQLKAAMLTGRDSC